MESPLQLTLLLATALLMLRQAASATILPPLLSTPQTDLYLTEGQTEVVLECKLDIGDDPIRYRWLKQYKLVTAALGHAYRTKGKVHLSLHRINRNHEGLYECEAANDAGINAVSIYVHVQPSHVSYQKQVDDAEIQTSDILADIATSLNDVLAEGKCECDVMFLLHASPEAPDQTLQAQANLAYTIAQSIISEKMRVAVMTYSDYVNPKLNFGSGTDECALRDAFKDLSHEKWATRIQPVLSAAYKKMKKSSKRCKVIFLQIFGSLGTEGAQESISAQIIKNGIKLFILEATNSPIAGVEDMASKRGDSKPHHWRIPLKIWSTIIPFMNYMKEELFGCMRKPSQESNMCVNVGTNCTHSDQCSGIGYGCVQGVCRSLECHREPEKPGCCTNGANFYCGDVTMDCQSKDIVCDGKYQCMNGLDEEDCWLARCPVSMVRCHSSVLCLSLYQLCDGEPHCPSAEDEDANFCRSHPCPVDRPFRCKSGKCISVERLCDGAFMDCEDGDDEHLNYCNAVHVCPASRPFKCDYGVCIPESKVCDGAYNCLDALDETLCDAKSCPADRPFKCSDSRCVELDMVCNGIIDACSDGSDELNCDKFVCPSSRSLKCRNGKCIDRWLECDKRDDCGDGTDELLCNVTTSTTPRVAPPPTSTEDNMAPTDTIGPREPCSDLEFFCSNGFCLNYSMVCDGRKHCQDGDDEDPEICTNFPCPEERPHRCPDLSCVVVRACDGIFDCSDGSDEKGCPDSDLTNVEVVEPEPGPEPEPEPEPKPKEKDSSTIMEAASPAASSGGMGDSAADSYLKIPTVITIFVPILSLINCWVR